MISARTRPAVRPPGAGDAEGPLVRRAARGDDAAFEALFVRYREPLSRYCRAVLGHEQDAEDAFQQAMIRVHRALGSRGPDGPLRPWLFRVAHNECMRLAGGRRPAAALTEAHAAPGAGPPERAEEREALAQLRDDLLALPHPQRAALVMRELSGLSHRQIGLALEASPETAKQLIHQARCALGEFDAGRSLACSDVRRRLSDRDGRVLRARVVTSHLRACEGCRAFRAGIARRPRHLAALVPPLPALAAERVLSSVLAGGAGAGAGGLGGAGLIGGIGAIGAVVATSAALVVTGALPIGPGGAGGAAPPPPPPVAASAPTASAGVPAAATAPRRTPARSRPAAAAAPAPAPAAPEATPLATATPTPSPGPSAAAPPADPAPRPPATVDPQPAPAAPVTASAALSSGPSGAGVNVDAGVALPAAGAGASAGVGAGVSPDAGVDATVDASVTTPVTPPLEASVSGGVTPGGDVALAVTPPLGLPAVTVGTPALR